MQNSSDKSVSVDIATLLGCDKAPHKSDDVAAKEYNVAGCVHPLRPQMTARGTVPVGTSVLDAIEDACKTAGVRKRLWKRGVAQIGTRDVQKGVTVWRNVPQGKWKQRKIGVNELLRFRMLPSGGGGGGGGKNILNTILSVVVMVVAVVASVWSMGALSPTFTMLGMSATMSAGVVGGLVGLAVTTIGMVLVNAIAPVKPPSFSGLGTSRESRAAESKVYGVSAGQNAINQWGRVPVPLGKGRFSPPKAASAYTQLIGEDMYLHELLCLGIGDTAFSNIKIGTTPITEYADATYEIFKSGPTPVASSHYPTGHFQDDFDIEVEKSEGWAVRRSAECDSLEVDLYMPGLGYMNDQGGISDTTVALQVQYKMADKGDWNSVGSRKNVAGASSDTSSSGTRKCVAAVHYQKGCGVFWDVDYPPDTGWVPLKRAQVVNGAWSWLPDLPTSANAAHTLEGFGVNFVSWGGAREKGLHDSAKGTSSCDYELVPGWDKSCEGNKCYCRLASSYFETERYSTEHYVCDDGGCGSYYTPHQICWCVRAARCGIDIAGGWITPIGESSGAFDVSYTAHQTRVYRATVVLNPRTRGVYDVRVNRVTDDSTNDRVMNDTHWSCLRSISNDPPVKTSYPVNLMAITIRATGQLSGSIQTLSLDYQTSIKDYDFESRSWIQRYSSNPASLFRHVLTDGYASARPAAEEELDYPAIEAAHSYWKGQGWSWNLVCDASVSVFERVQSICASGLASPTMVDGKWSIIIDKPRDIVKMALTSANSWNWSFKRTQVRLPNEIHCTFVDEATWDTNMRVVATDEPVDPGKELLFEMQTYEGINSPAQIYSLARFHYFDARARRRTISLRCYDEALMATRGDLVECAAPNISPLGLQVGRVRRVFRDENNNVTHFTTDQVQSTDFSGRRFGVKVWTQFEGVALHAEVLPENKAQKVLTLISPQVMSINPGDKYAFGDYDEETFQAIILSMRYNADWTCDILLQDYIPALYQNASEAAPDFISPITPPVVIRAYNVTAEEVWLSDGKDSAGASIITARWSGRAEKWNIFLQLEDATPQLHGSTEKNHYDVAPVSSFKTYKVYITPYDVATKAPFAVVFTQGKAALPSNVQNFTGKVSGETITFRWDHIRDSDLQGYRIKRGSSWETGEIVIDGVAENAAQWDVPLDGTYKFYIKAFDTSGNFSRLPTVLLVDADVEKGLNVIVKHDELPDGIPNAEIIEAFTALKQGTELAWTPGLTNEYIDADMTNTSFADYAGGTEDGVYLSQQYNLGRFTKASIRIGVDWKAEEYFVTNMTFPARTNVSFPYDTNLFVTSSSIAITEYRIGEDFENEEGVSVIKWSVWNRFLSVANFAGKYIQLRVRTKIENISCFLNVTRISTVVDVDDVIVLMKNILIPVEGKTFSLEDEGLWPVYVGYYVGATALGTTGKYPVVEKNEETFIVRVFDEVGPVAAYVDLQLRGF